MPQHKDSRLLNVPAWEVMGLEVNMHCTHRKCRKKLDKAIKIIKSCEGVNYMATVADEHKVIVSANEASAKVLGKKLRKTGKHKKSWLREVDQNLFLTEEDTPLSDRHIVFKMKTLVTATDNFHDDKKLGVGAFGTVYKGFYNGKEIAVKKLSPTSWQGKEEFLNEVKLLKKTYHRNVVNLLGWCEEGSEMLLVYEYLPNMSLEKFLADADKRKDLDWQKRRHIIAGVARGLCYIHEDTPEHIVHRDIKSSNILLDRDLNPKIGDLGTANHFPEDKTHFTAEVLHGTFGYVAPEYVNEGQVSLKSDVYSFGVVDLELMTGRNAADRSQEPLVKWVWSSYKEGKISQTIDPEITETRDKEQALRCILIGLLCTQEDSSRRPPMSEVYSMLSDPCKAVPLPKTPTSATADASITNSVSRKTMAPRNGHVAAVKRKLASLKGVVKLVLE